MKRVVLVLLTLLLGSVPLLGQVRTVTGVVTDAATGEPLPLVNIQIKGTQQGTVTDGEGRYSLRVPGPEAVLRFFYTGYADEERTVGDQTAINVAMGEQLEEIDQVVVVAYGTAKKETLVGAQATVSSEQMERRPITNPVNALAGAVAGVQVTTASGQPGSSGAMRIRGFGSINASNAPLIIVDGTPYNGSVADIAQSDIETFTVLKDAASTSLYGSSAGNGVVLITTKSGARTQGANKCDLKPSFTFTTTHGGSQKGMSDYKKLGALDWVVEHWRQYYNQYIDEGDSHLEAAFWANYESQRVIRYNPFGQQVSTYFAARSADQLAEEPINLNTTQNPLYVPVWVREDGTLNPQIQRVIWDDDQNWEDYLFRTGYRQEYTLSGGLNTAKMRSFLSLNYMKDNGYRLNTHFSRMSARLNLSYDINKWITVGSNTSYTRSTSESPKISDDTYYANPFFFVRTIGPLYPIHVHDQETGDYILDEHGEKIYDHNVQRPSFAKYNAIEEAYKDKSVSERDVVSNRSNLRVNIIDGLTFTMNFAYDLYRPSYTMRYNNEMGDQPQGLLNMEAGRNQTITFNQLLNYNQTFADVHNIDLLFGHENYMYQTWWLYAEKEGMGILDMDVMANASTMRRITSGGVFYRKEGYFFRANYSFASRYNVSASYRRDGSSRFAPGKKWGNFWSAGVSWNISSEEFMRDLSEYINFMKLRFSIGQTGNDGVGNYAGISYWGVGADNGVFTGYSHYLGAPDLVWESQTSYDLGLEFNLINRISGTLEFFVKNSADLIFAFPLPASSGYTTQDRNIGKVSNMGIEFELAINLLTLENLKWDFNVNGTWLRNRIVRLPDENREDGIELTYRKYMEGYSMYEYYLREFVGVDPENGRAVYRLDKEKYAGQTGADPIAKEGPWSEYTYNATFAKKHFCGSSIPDLYGGFGTTLYAYGADLGISFSYQIGGKSYDYGYQSMMGRQVTGADSWHEDVQKAWKKPGDRTNIPALNAGTNGLYNNSTSDRYLISGSAIMLRSLTVGYTFPDRWLNVIHISGLRLGFAAENLFLASHRKGLNPMEDFGDGAGGYNLAFARTFTGSLTFNF